MVESEIPASSKSCYHRPVVPRGDEDGTKSSWSRGGCFVVCGYSFRLHEVEHVGANGVCPWERFSTDINWKIMKYN